MENYTITIPRATYDELVKLKEKTALPIDKVASLAIDDYFDSVTQIDTENALSGQDEFIPLEHVASECGLVKCK